MNLYAAFATCLGAFALLHYLIVPKAEATLRGTIGALAVPRAATFSVLALLRSVALLATVSCAVTIVAMWIVNLLGGSTVAELSATLDRLRRVRTLVTTFDPVLAIVGTLLIVFGLVTLARRQAKMTFSAAHDEAVRLELDRVLTDGREGRWAELPPTPLIAELVTRAGKLEAEAATLETALAEPPPLPDDLPGQRTRDRQRGRSHQVGEELTELHQRLLREQVQRRMDVRFDPTALIPRAPNTRWGRVGTFFVSRGLMTSMRGVSRLAFAAGMLLLVPSLLALAAPGLALATDTRITAVEQLRIDTDMADAAASMRAITAAQTKADEPPTAADTQALDALAHQYEISLARQYANVLHLPDVAVHAEALRTDVMRESVRDRIVHADAGRIAVQPSDLTPLQRDLASLQMSADRNGPITPAGREFRAALDRDLRVAAPQRWAAVRQHVQASLAAFQQPVSPRELQGMLISRVVTAGTDTVAPELADIVSGLDVRTLNRVREDETEWLKVELARGEPPEKAFAHFADFPTTHTPWPDGPLVELRTVAQRTPNADELAERVHTAPPGFASATEHADLSRAAAATREMAAQVYRGGAVPDGMGDALAGFGDHFPGRAAAAQTTAYREVRSGLGLVAEEASAVGRVAMARSFSLLSGFRRIGGVLIGRPPENRGPLDFRGIDWRQADGRVSLILRRADNKLITVGPYRPEIVHLALAYAADGRPVTATMVTASPLLELKIMLHPALVDTAMGCRAIDVDRLVDTFARTKENDVVTPRAIDRARVDSYLTLYRWVWAVTVHAAVTALADVPTEHDRLFQLLDKDAVNILNSFATADGGPPNEAVQDLTFALSQRDKLRDPAYSPLPAKPEFFAPVTVRAIGQCAAPTIAATEQCLDRFATAQAKIWAGDSSLAWAAPPPDIQIWSGVREHPFTADSDLSFAAPALPATQAAPFGSLDFILQVAFTTPPYLADPKQPWYTTSEADLNGRTDATPWQFPHLQPWISAKVQAGIAADANAADVFSAAREFTAAQRLFRLALDGGLGADFPLTRLAELAEQSRDWVRSGVRTPRWNPVPAALEGRAVGAAEAILKLDDAPEALQQAAHHCVDTVAPKLDDMVSRVALGRMSPDDWGKTCGFDGIDRDTAPEDAKGLLGVAREVGYARTIRQQLGVPEEDANILTRTTTACPPF
jgi:hypothetical protein